MAGVTIAESLLTPRAVGPGLVTPPRKLARKPSADDPPLAPGTPPQPQAERPWRKSALRRPAAEVGVTLPPAQVKKARVSFEEPPAPAQAADNANTKSFNLFQAKQRGANEPSKAIRVALLEMFAGLRTCHVAVKKVKHLNFVVSHAAECCAFANAIAQKNGIQETLHRDVHLLNEEWAAAFIAEAVQQEADAILIAGGFPCKDLSRQQQQQDRKNLQGKYSGLFYEIPRVRELLVKAAAAASPTLKVYHIVENVVMDKDPETDISDALGGRPTLIEAGSVCGATRPRLFWTNFEIRPTAGEVLERTGNRNKLKLVPTPMAQKLDFWDEGWGPHPNFRHNYPCIVGWEYRSAEPRDPRGKYDASAKALERWKEDHWATGIRFYEDVNMAWSKTAEGISRPASPTECERMLGFPPKWTEPAGPIPGYVPHRMQYTRKNAVGNAFAVPVIARLLSALVAVVSVPGGGAFPAYSSSNLMAPYVHDALDDILPEAACIAADFGDLTNSFDQYIATEWTDTLVGPDPGAIGRKNRSQRAAALGSQLGGHLSKNGMTLMVPEEGQEPMEHVKIAHTLRHPFTAPPELPLDLKFAAAASALRPTETNLFRGRQMHRIHEMAARCSDMDEEIRSRLAPEVSIAAATMNLGFLTALTFLLRWPDWQLSTLFTRGFRVVGLVEPSNVYPRVTPNAVESLASLLDPEEADKWNCKVQARSLRSDLDSDIFEAAQEQVGRGLLSPAKSKRQIDKIFGVGKWRAIRRRGLQQGEKVRGIDNARCSKTNMAAFLVDTIMTTSHDVAMQIVSWLFTGEEGNEDFERLRHTLVVMLGADDLADAYHGLPNAVSQLGFCVVAIMNPKLNRIQFHVSYTHLFGLTAAVVNFNRLPELLTAACRRLGQCTTWHFFDDQGTVEFQHSGEEVARNAGADSPPSMTAQEFVQELFRLVGRPFKAKKHLPPAQKQVHLGLLNDFSEFQKGQMRITPKEGKLEEMHAKLLDLRDCTSKKASIGEVMHITGSLIFLLMACFDKVGRGGLQPFYAWIADHADASSLWKTKGTKCPITSQLYIGIEFFVRVIPLIRPRVYHLGHVTRRPVVAYSDAEWTPRDPPLLPKRGLGGCIWVDDDSYACAIDAPMEVVNSLAIRKTQIIPLELIAAAGTLTTYAKQLEGRDVIFFIDNQSVCGALAKGTSRSRDIQNLTTAWHFLALKLRCRIWIEWVPSESNPADMLSREYSAPFVPSSSKVDDMLIPEWTNQEKFGDIRKIFEAMKETLNERTP